MRYSLLVRRVEYPKFADWMQTLPREVFVEAEADVRYALLRNAPRCCRISGCGSSRLSTIRTWPRREPRLWTASGRHWIVRTLAVFADDDAVPAFCVGGDKRAWSDANPTMDWYDAWVPVADQIFRLMKQREGWK